MIKVILNLKISYIEVKFIHNLYEDGIWFQVK
jgi:hypothetical protein